jgi:Flp pilus assembly protein CpaB
MQCHLMRLLTGAAGVQDLMAYSRVQPAPGPQDAGAVVIDAGVHGRVEVTVQARSLRRSERLSASSLRTAGSPSPLSSAEFDDADAALPPAAKGAAGAHASKAAASAEEGEEQEERGVPSATDPPQFSYRKIDKVRVCVCACYCWL